MLQERRQNVTMQGVPLHTFGIEVREFQFVIVQDFATILLLHHETLIVEPVSSNRDSLYWQIDARHDLFQTSKALMLRIHYA